MLKPIRRNENKFTITDCPKTIERVNDSGDSCTAKLDTIASGTAGKCTYGACVAIYRNTEFGVDGFKNNFGTIEDELMFSNSIGSWFHNLWSKLKNDEQRLKSKIGNLFHKKNKTQDESKQLADAQAQLKATQDQLAELQLNLDSANQQLADASSNQQQNNSTNPSWNTPYSTPQTGVTDLNNPNASKDSSFDSGDILGIVFGLAIAGTIIWLIRKEYKHVKGINVPHHNIAHRPTR